MPIKPWTLAPKRSLGIFEGLGNVLDKRQQRQDAATAKQQTLEDRLAAKEVRDKEMVLLDERIKDMQAPPPLAKPNRTYDPGRGKVIDLDAGTATDLGFDPVTKPETPRNIDPLSPEGIKAATERAGAVARATANVKPTEPKPHAPAEFEKKAAFMIEGAEGAVKTLENYEATPRSWVNKIPGAGNYGMTPEDQVAQQAAETLHDAYLRLTTGATINKDELARAAKQYIAQPGDAPQVLAAKKERREQIIRAIRGAASSVKRPGDPAPPISPNLKPAGDPEFDALMAKYAKRPPV